MSAGLHSALPAFPEVVGFVAIASARAVVAAILLIAGGPKLADVDGFAKTTAQALGNVHLNAAIIAGMVIAAELVVGFMLLLSWPLPLAAWLAGGLFISFAAVMGANRLAGRKTLHCGCFGTQSSASSTTWLAIRASLLAAAALAGGLPVSMQFEGATRGGWPAQEVAAVAVIGLVVLLAWAIVRSTAAALRTSGMGGDS